MKQLQIFTTGGTIDKVYFDALSEFQVGDSGIGNILSEANISFKYEITPLMKKDSLELTDEDRDLILGAIENSDADKILVTHGTDTMAMTAQHVSSAKEKTIVFTGSMLPASHRATDAVFNVGFAIACAQLLSAGTYLAMNGKVFDPANVVKDREVGLFKSINHKI